MRKIVEYNGIDRTSLLMSVFEREKPVLDECKMVQRMPAIKISPAAANAIMQMDSA